MLGCLALTSRRCLTIKIKREEGNRVDRAAMGGSMIQAIKKIGGNNGISKPFGIDIFNPKLLPLKLLVR